MICKYSRNADGNPDGVLVAEKVDAEGTVLIGWSAYNLSGEDRSFTKDLAVKIARQRIVKGNSSGTIPRRMRPMLPYFMNRCRRYFKTDCIILVGSQVEESMSS